MSMKKWNTFPSMHIASPDGCILLCDVPGLSDYIGYAISSVGILYSCKYKNRYRSEWVKMKQRKAHNGYMRCTIYKEDGFSKEFPIHVLVSRAFIPNPNSKPQVNHKDFNKENNHVSNLEWCTQKENVEHARKAGRHPNNQGEKHGMSALTDNLVLQLRERFKNGERQCDLCREYDIKPPTMCRIVNNTGYKHLISPS